MKLAKELKRLRIFKKGKFVLKSGDKIKIAIGSGTG